MGVRAKRRLVIGGIAALMIAGVVTAFVTTHSGSSSPSESHASKEAYGIFGAFGVTYGMRGKQVLARFGRPDRKRNGCWTYRIRGGTFHGFKLIPQIAGVDAVRYCFYSNVVTVIDDHWRPGMHNDPLPQAWTPPIQFGCGSGPCKRRAAQ